jgi:hypothetical protein
MGVKFFADHCVPTSTIPPQQIVTEVIDHAHGHI